MADHTHIEWTDATWNPITGCTLVSEGCRHCYAATLAATRLKNIPSRAGLARMNAAGEAKFTGEVRFNEQWIDQPLRWRKPRRIFVCAHSDLFHEAVPDEWIDRIFAVMAGAQRHTFQILTKRPERAAAYLPGLASRIYDAYGGMERFGDYHLDGIAHDTAEAWPLPNVWLGTSVEDQATAEARIPHLLATPAAVRFVSAEPLLGPVDMDAILAPDMGIYALTGIRSDGSGPSGFSQGPRLDWVIVGGESGPGARPMHPGWARSLRDQCQAAGVAYFFKQWGEWAPALHDPEHDGYILRQTENVGQFDSWKATVFDPNRLEGVNWRRLGKSRAGRLLAGREWNQMPGVRA